MRKPCNGCPFLDGITDEASQNQNYGCLPTSFDMLQHFDERGVSISCHRKGDLLCGGLLERRPDAINKPIRDQQDWSNTP